MSDSESELSERARQLRQQAVSEPAAVDSEELAKILSIPTAPPSAHGAALVALLNVARVRDDVGATFVDDVARLLGRPSVSTPLVLRCLRQLATNDPEAVLEYQDEITDRISTDDPDLTQAATGCCAALIETEPIAFVDLVPTLAALLDAENEQIRKNAVYIISQIAHEYPEEVKPVVPQLIASLKDRDDTYRTNALSALGAIVSAYPAAGIETTETVADLAASTAAPKVRGNALGLLGDIAAEYPAEIVNHIPVLVECLQVDDEYIVGNAVAALLHVAVDDAEGVEPAIPYLIEHLDHPSPVVRRNVCRTLGQVDALVALEQLKATAEHDPDDGVRTIASQAIDQIS